MKQKLGTRPYGHYVWGAGGRGRMRVCPTGRARLVGFSLVALPSPFSFRAPCRRRAPTTATRGEHPRPTNGPLHRKPPGCPRKVVQQGSKEGRENLACQNLHSRLPRFPRLGLSDLTTRLSTHSGDRYQVNCVRSSSCVSITATSEIPFFLYLLPLTLAQKWIRRTLENSRIFMPCCP